LYIRRRTNINPIIYGGGQQGQLRSGTENVPGIIGFAEALILSVKNKKKESARIKKMRDTLEKGIFKSIPKVVLNGHQQKRLPNFLNISILDVEGEALLLYLDEIGIMVSTGSACNSQSLEPSYVLSALGNPYEYVHGSIRFTLGKNNTMSDIKYVLKHLPIIAERLRSISPLELKIDQIKTISDPRAFIGNQTPHFLRKKPTSTSPSNRAVAGKEKQNGK
jgi:cysteine desulfurase